MCQKAIKKVAGGLVRDSEKHGSQSYLTKVMELQLYGKHKYNLRTVASRYKKSLFFLKISCTVFA